MRLARLFASSMIVGVSAASCAIESVPETESTESTEEALMPPCGFGLELGFAGVECTYHRSFVANYGGGSYNPAGGTCIDNDSKIKCKYRLGHCWAGSYSGYGEDCFDTSQSSWCSGNIPPPEHAFLEWTFPLNLGDKVCEDPNANKYDYCEGRRKEIPAADWNTALANAQAKCKNVVKYIEPIICCMVSESADVDVGVIEEGAGEL